MRPIKKKEMIVVVGPPGSGKTVLLDDFQGYVKFDNDRVIEATWGRLQYHPQIKRLAKGMVREGIRRAMRYGLAIALPISGRTKRDRSRILSMALEFEYRTVVYVLMTDESECISRCEADPVRPKTTNWTPIIKRWFSVFEPVEESEADEVIIKR